MLDSRAVKEILFALGVDLCGIAGMERFDDAPKGFHPSDVLPTCKSVISFACRFPVGTLACKSDIPYTRVRNSITPKMDAMALDFCIEMEKHHVVCVPIPTNESRWDKNTGRWRPIVSQKHIAQACWDFAFGDDKEEGIWKISCHRCRDICPYNLGSENGILGKGN